ncbi:hypothetical protein BJ138DRAFT_1103668 [Hygrophoropsis aurantiaca]|uniref:Uncharacterized protein n=1 Tax=Hygrophoropsis aurantiaca TaxID=72124 RepID=A0ACB8A412_9AGAM|nr:hypothetical protein BJ138DRAFT_1103668 [Hygrophoropsis aurantiaca]
MASHWSENIMDYGGAKYWDDEKGILTGAPVLESKVVPVEDICGTYQGIWDDNEGMIPFPAEVEVTLSLRPGIKPGDKYLPKDVVGDMIIGEVNVTAAKLEELMPNHWKFMDLKCTRDDFDDEIRDCLVSILGINDDAGVPFIEVAIDWSLRDDTITFIVKKIEDDKDEIKGLSQAEMERLGMHLNYCEAEKLWKEQYEERKQIKGAATKAENVVVHIKEESKTNPTTGTKVRVEPGSVKMELDRKHVVKDMHQKIAISESVVSGSIKTESDHSEPWLKKEDASLSTTLGLKRKAEEDTEDTSRDTSSIPILLHEDSKWILDPAMNLMDTKPIVKICGTFADDWLRGDLEGCQGYVYSAFSSMDDTTASVHFLDGDYEGKTMSVPTIYLAGLCPQVAHDHALVTDGPHKGSVVVLRNHEGGDDWEVSKLQSMVGFNCSVSAMVKLYISGDVDLEPHGDTKQKRIRVR